MFFEFVIINSPLHRKVFNLELNIQKAGNPSGKCSLMEDPGR